MLKHAKWVGLAALAVAWSFDFLFWKKPPGISFAIFVLLCLGAGLLLARAEDKHPSLASMVLILPILLFAALSFIRAEPLTIATMYLLVMGSLALLAISFLGGRWPVYSLPDYIIGLFNLGVSALAGVVQYRLYSSDQKKSEPAGIGPRPSGWKTALPMVRGVFLAVPVVTVFAALLASADPIFSKRLTDFFDLLDIENLPETLWRIFYISVIAYGLAGIFLHALLHSQDDHLVGLEKPWLPLFFGFTEAAVVLASVCLLFASFVAIQFQYFFGGHANITLEGFTYAEYARRGFGELVAVAFFSLVLLLGLNSATRRQTSVQRVGFSSLVAVLVALVVIILVSAFQRLLLYEQAYGFTRTRTVIHIFMIWLGVLLVATLILELANRVRIFPAAVLLVAIGFGVTLSLVNIDAWIVQQNVQRAQSGLPFDSAYLMGLSTDAVPGLVWLYGDPTLSKEVRLGLGGALACQAARVNEDNQKLAWQSFNISRSRANQFLKSLGSSLSDYPVSQDTYGRWVVKVNGNSQLCNPGTMD